MRLTRAILLLSCIAAGPALAQPKAVAPTQTLIRNVTVFDGVRKLGERSVLIEGKTIADIDYRGKVSPTMRVMDGRGKTLLPGLIDSHVHAYAGQDDALLFGVTTQLDMFSPPESTRAVRDRMAHGENANMADIFTAGFLATVPKGHGTEYGLPVPTLTTPEQADAWVAARIAEGSDYIKIVDEPGTIVGRAVPTLDLPTIRGLIVAAHKRGKLAVVHAQTLATATESINAGADGLAHLFADQDGGATFATLAKDKGVFIVPTYAVLEVFSGRSGTATLLDHPRLSGLLPKSAVSMVRQSFGPDRSAKLDAIEAANVGKLAKAGVPILAGTDAGNPGTWYGLSLHREMELLVKGGLSPIQALSAATAAPAKAFRLTDRGRIATGLKADLVLVDGDPTSTIAAVHDIVEIWKDGATVSALRAARRTAIATESLAVAPPPIALPADGRIAQFSAAEGKVVMTSPFGAGWSVSTDTIMGGKSTLATALGGAAPNGQTALVVTGEIKPGYMAPWAGIAFYPADQQFQPANLGRAKALRLWARGEGKSFAVMGFSTTGGQRPSVAPITIGKDWAELTLRFADLANFDPTTAQMVLIGATQHDGPFRLEIADIRLVEK
ncbi:amidohydrolase family protein [Sphingomonas sp. PB4P5]|uniref:amidohydrolase family protein n=1 Tax=Parasphingomonas puruogangriensis TaxID=3096155 RepID=UPI002FC604F4